MNCSVSISREQDDEPRARAELPAAKQTAPCQLRGDLASALDQRAGQHEHGVDARHFEIDGLAYAIGGGLEGDAGRPAARKPARADPRVRHQSLARVVVDLVEKLHGRARQPAFGHGGERLFGEHPRRSRMQRMPLGDHRIAGGYGRRKVAAGGSVEREGKIVRAENHDRPDRLEARADLVFRVDGRQRPRAFERRLRSLPQLGNRPRQLDIGQPRRRRQCGLEIGDLDQRGLAHLEPLGKSIQEARDRFGRRAPKLVRGSPPPH